MIYITGDCHADFTRFNTDNFPEQSEMTKDDYVIIRGDFGGVWNKDEESPREKWWMYRPDMLTKYLQEIAKKIKYKKWFFGHYHDNRNVGDKGILIYEQIIRIA